MKGPSGEASVILASGSPRRRKILEALGWAFEVDVPDICETMFPGERAEDAVVRLAMEKALAVSARHSGKIVIAADTVVRLQGEVLGKPAGRREAFGILARLSGKVHEVLTGVAVIRKDAKAAGHELTLVEFRSLAEGAINAYLDCNDSYDKAGAYGIQEQGALLVQGIKGCYFNVVGLPLTRLSGLLEEVGVSLEQQWRMGI